MCLLVPALAAAAATRVAIVPFQINADKDYTFLQKGIQDMLSSRLAMAGKVDVIEPQTTRQVLDTIQGFSGDNLALLAGAKLKADYVLHGSITVLGESVSIDAKMLDVTGRKDALSFFRQPRGMGDVIPQINLLATEINQKIFNRAPAATAAPSSSPSPAAPAPPPQHDIHMHPEKLLQGNQAISDAGGSPFVQAQGDGGGTSLNPGFITPAGSASQGPAFWKSRNFDHLISGIAIGDVNADGLLETIVVTPDEVQIYQFAQQRMTKLKVVKAGSFSYNISVDVGDINDNGTPEIFISSLTSGRNKVRSMVLEYDGSDYKTLVSDANWYFRVIDHPARGELLLGQGQNLGADAFSDQIVELTWNGVEYLAGERILPANRACLLGFAMGDVLNDNSTTAAVLNPYDHLRILQLNGKEVWTSSDYYGGTPEHVLLPPADSGEPEVKFYLPVRLRVTDLEKDGKYEVIAIRNDDMADRKLAQQRLFRKGRLTALQWTGLGLATLWHTRDISGRIQDFAIGDFDNDGNREILCAVITKEGAIIGMESKSTLIAYELADAGQQ